jgi:hypothetical protein
MAIASGTLAALALAAAAAGTSYYNTRQTANKQDSAAAAGIRSQADRQRQADARTNQIIDAQAASTPDAAKMDTLGQYMQQVRASAAGAGRGIQQAGATSQAAEESAADAALGVSSYGGKIAELMAAMDAPQLQRRQEAVSMARGGSDIERVASFAGGDNFLNQLRLQGIRRNPWLDAFSSFAGGAASGAAGGWGGGAAAGTGAAGGTGTSFGSGLYRGLAGGY